MYTEQFQKLAPFIQDYIFQHQWQDLREVQAQAIDAILESERHILIASATASGKTEAALLPIITDLHRKPPDGIGAIYIGPLKALINDQFERLSGLLGESGIPLQHWHGDVPQTKKLRFLKQAKGILQITPESLEAMLMNRHHELGRLFSETRYVIIDEIHAFISSDRGRQVMCQLERLARFQKAPARRVGLSATIGEPELVMRWLRGNSGQDVALIKPSRTQSQVELALEYFLLPEASSEGSKDGANLLGQANQAAAKTPTEKLTGADRSRLTAPENPDSGVQAAGRTRLPERATDAASVALGALQSTEIAFQDDMHAIASKRNLIKTLIFTNSRGMAEYIGHSLKKAAERNGWQDIFHVHHGNISTPLREETEAIMRDAQSPACVVATVTLELGIDIGQLDQVLQVNRTHSVSSFVQRLGRSGRRGGPARMFALSIETRRDHRHFAAELPWDLLQTMAIIQLYLEEQWVEPPDIPQMPVSLLYHQTMSVIKSHSELSPPQLAERILTLSPFQALKQDHFRALLRHLLDIEHLEMTETGGLIIGLAAEKMIKHYSFYATFEGPALYRVREKAREIGTLERAPEVDSSILLAGEVWRVLKIHEDQRVIEVEKVKGESRTDWSGDGNPMHSRILQKMREILLSAPGGASSSSSYKYLQRRARRRLHWAQETAQAVGLAESGLLPLSDFSIIVLPWCGTDAFNTQILLLEAASFRINSSYAPYWYEIRHKEASMQALATRLRAVCANAPPAADLADRLPRWQLTGNKYDKFLPEPLLREAYSRDRIDIPGALASLSSLLEMSHELTEGKADDRRSIYAP